MANRTVDGLKALAAKFMSNPDYLQAIHKRLLFAKQPYVDHCKASGLKLLIGSMANEQSFVWALIIWKEGIIFYKQNGERLNNAAIKHVRLLEPMRTLAGNLQDTLVGNMRSHIMFMFMNEGALDDFLVDRCVTVNGFKHGCRLLANAMHKAVGSRRRGGADEGYETETESEDQEQTRAGVKRGHNGVGETGKHKRITRRPQMNATIDNLTTDLEVERAANMKLSVDYQVERFLGEVAFSDFQTVREMYNGVVRENAVVWKELEELKKDCDFFFNNNNVGFLIDCEKPLESVDMKK